MDNPPVIAGPAVSTSPAATPPHETAKLKEARVFLNDAQKFIAEQKSVPAISAIANEAANLKIALTNFDEAGAVQSMAHLNALLIPISGFAEFEKQLLADRNREDARQLAEATSEGDKNIYIIDNSGRIEIKDGLVRRSLVRLQEQVDEEPLDGHRIVTDLVIARRLQAAQLQPVARRESTRPIDPSS